MSASSDPPMKKCDKCEQQFQESAMTWLRHDNVMLCKECVEEHAILCDGCSELYLDDDSITHPTTATAFCALCVENGEDIYECDGECGEWFPRNELNVTGRGLECDDCWHGKSESEEE